MPERYAVLSNSPSPLARSLAQVPIHWVRPDEPPPAGALRFSQLWLEPRPTSTARLYAENPAAFGGDAASPSVALLDHPTFDDVVALAMWLWERGGDAGAGRPTVAAGGPRAIDAAWQALAHYAENVRQGLSPERVSPELSPNGVYHAIVDQRLEVPRPDPASFLEDALHLVEVLRAGLQAGKSLLADDLVGAQPFLVEYVEVLRTDRQRYLEDVANGQRFWAVLPAAATGGAPVRAPMLVLTTARSTHLKSWARRDPGAPGGAGYTLLMTQKAIDVTGAQGGGRWEVRITADPTRRLRVGFLAAALSKLEPPEPGGAARPWYDGAEYDGTMCASPLDGTLLPLAKVVEVLRGELQLRPVRPRWWLPTVTGAPVAAALVAGLVALWPHLFPPAVVPPAAPGGKSIPDGGGHGADPGPVDLDAFRARKNRALLVATNEYTHPKYKRLEYPVPEARRLEPVLRARGFEVEVLANPTLEEFDGALRRYEALPWSGFDQFVLFVSGHGRFSDAWKSGALVFKDSTPANNRFLELPVLRDRLTAHPARHLLVLLDACHAGTFAQAVAFGEQRLEYKSADEAAVPAVTEAAAARKLVRRTRRFMAAVGNEVAPARSAFTAALTGVLGTAQHGGFLTDVSLFGHLEGVEPTPEYWSFGTGQWADEGGVIVFAPLPAAATPP